MANREFMAFICIAAFLFCNVTAADSSLINLVTGGSRDSGFSVPGLPPPEEGSVLQRKLLDTQPYVFKTSDRLLHEAEISRDQGIREYQECMEKVTDDINNLDDTKQRGIHYTVDQVKQMYRTSSGTGVGYYSATEICTSAHENYNMANTQYRAALAATKDDDYAQQAEIFESGSKMYETAGNTQAQEQMDNAAMAARARAAAERLPLSPGIAILALVCGFALLSGKRA